MADSTALVAAITGVSTLTAGIGGAYLTARQQSVTARRAIEAERQKADRDRRDKASDGRVETYRELLDVERELRMLVASGQDFDESDFSEWLTNFNRTYNLVVLTGWTTVREKADTLFNELQTMARDRMQDHSERSFAQQFRAAYAHHDPQLQEIRDGLIEQMRQDIAPRQPSSGDG